MFSAASRFVPVDGTVVALSQSIFSPSTRLLLFTLTAPEAHRSITELMPTSAASVTLAWMPVNLSVAVAFVTKAALNEALTTLKPTAFVVTMPSRVAFKVAPEPTNRLAPVTSNVSTFAPSNGPSVLPVPVSTSAVALPQLMLPESATIATSVPLPISRPALPPRSSMLPVTPPSPPKMKASSAFSAPVRFSIRLKLMVGVNPATATEPTPSPVRVHDVSASKSTTIESPRRIRPTIVSMSK